MQNSQSCPTCWKVPDRGWEDVDQQIDLFLSQAIQAIAREYVDEPVEWLKISRWPDLARLIVYPSRNLKGDRDERICCQMFSDFLEAEWDRSAKSGPDSQNEAWECLAEKVWQSVLNSLQDGAASQVLAQARNVHRLWIAIYDYALHEGLFHLENLNPQANQTHRSRCSKIEIEEPVLRAPSEFQWFPFAVS